MLFRETMHVFACNGFEFEEFDENLNAVLSNLEVFLLPTSAVIDIIGNVEHKVIYRLFLIVRYIYLFITN